MSLVPSVFLVGAVLPDENVQPPESTVMVLSREYGRAWVHFAPAREFRIGPLPSGSYDVIGSLPGHDPVVEELELERNPLLYSEDPADFVLRTRILADRPESNGLELTGRTLRNGSPASGVTVRVETECAVHEQATDSQGQFTFSGLKRGAVQVVAGTRLDGDWTVVPETLPRVDVDLDLARGGAV